MKKSFNQTLQKHGWWIIGTSLLLIIAFVSLHSMAQESAMQDNLIQDFDISPANTPVATALVQSATAPPMKMGGITEEQAIQLAKTHLIEIYELTDNTFDHYMASDCFYGEYDHFEKKAWQVTFEGAPIEGALNDYFVSFDLQNQCLQANEPMVADVVLSVLETADFPTSPADISKDKAISLAQTFLTDRFAAQEVPMIETLSTARLLYAGDGALTTDQMRCYTLHNKIADKTDLRSWVVSYYLDDIAPEKRICDIHISATTGEVLQYTANDYSYEAWLAKYGAGWEWNQDIHNQYNLLYRFEQKEYYRDPIQGELTQEEAFEKAYAFWEAEEGVDRATLESYGVQFYVNEYPASHQPRWNVHFFTNEPLKDENLCPYYCTYMDAKTGDIMISDCGKGNG